MERISAYKETLYNSTGAFELEIIIGATKLPDIKSKAIAFALYDAAKAIKTEVLSQIVRDQPDSMRAVELERASLLSMFKTPIYVEEIPNGYCSEYCCRHRPWFVVTTSVGRFTIGWRKRVIQIDWKDTVGTKPAIELFPEEKTTMEDKYIHAWSLEDAARYIETVIKSGIKV